MSFICDPDCVERATCPQAGQPGHVMCGRCPTHDLPRHHCGCVAEPTEKVMNGRA